MEKLPLFCSFAMACFVPKTEAGNPWAGSRVSVIMPSTVIRRFDYRPETRLLEVLLVTGRRYLYADVPPDEAERFRNAFSKGRYFNARIRDKYRCRELV
jgi:hypothetical protein